MLARLLSSLREQTRQDFEVVIVDSSDENSHLKEAIEQAQSLSPKIIHLGCGKGTARNVGARFCRTEILVFVDADVVLPRHFAQEVLRLFSEDEHLVALGFPIFPTKLNAITSLTYNGLNTLNRFSYKYGKPRIQTTCAAYRRSVFQDRFFLDLIGEDILFSADIMKYGKAVYAEQIRVFEEPRRWEGPMSMVKGLYYYFPSYVIYLLTFLGLHNLLMPKVGYHLLNDRAKLQ